MAVKGDRGRLEPVAARMYADGRSLGAIEEALGVSRRTLSKWKAQAQRKGVPADPDAPPAPPGATPGVDPDEWDRARAARRGFEDRLEGVRESLLKELEESSAVSAQDVPRTLIDALAKVDALIERNRRAARETAEALGRQKSELFLAVLRDLLEYGRRDAPGLATALEDHFDDVVEWGRGKYGV